MPLNLNRLQYFIDCGRIDVSKPINMNTLWTTGAVSKVGDGICLLGTVSPSVFYSNFVSVMISVT